MITWEEIKNDPLYQVSNDGKIKSFLSHDNGRILKQRNDKDGYKMVWTRFNSALRVHRAVAEAFIPNPENKPVVNHINGIKDDNRVENLEWATHQENTRHSYENRLQISNKNYNIIVKEKQKIISIFTRLEDLSKHCGINRNTLKQLIDKEELFFEKWSFKIVDDIEEYPQKLIEKPFITRKLKTYQSQPVEYNGKFYENATVLSRVLGVTRDKVVRAIQKNRMINDLPVRHIPKYKFVESND